jgi:hypothetical protein
LARVVDEIWDAPYIRQSTFFVETLEEWEGKLNEANYEKTAQMNKKFVDLTTNDKPDMWMDVHVKLLEKFALIIEELVEQGLHKDMTIWLPLESEYPAPAIKLISGYYVGGSCGKEMLGKPARYYARMGLAWNKIMTNHLVRKGDLMITTGVSSILDKGIWETFLKDKVCNLQSLQGLDLEYLRACGCFGDSRWSSAEEVEDEVRDAWDDCRDWLAPLYD